MKSDYRGSLAFVEFEEQVEPMLSRLGRAKVRLIALTPHVEYALDRLGIPYRRPEAYYDEERLEQFGIGNFQTVERLCTLLDQYWQGALPYLSRHGLRPAWSCFYELKILYDAATIRLFQLQQILGSERPARVLFYSTTEATFGQDLRWAHHESIYSRLLELMCRVRGIDAERVEWSPPPAPTSREATRASVRDRAKGSLKALLMGSGLWPAIEVYRKVGPRMALPALLSRIFRLRDPKKAILFNSLDYGIPWALTRLLAKSDLDLWLWREGEPPYRFRRLLSRMSHPPPDGPPPFPETALAEVWQALRTKPEFRQFFVFGGLDWFPLVEKRLHFFGTSVLRKFVHVHRQALPWLQRIRPGAVVMAPTIGVWRRALIHAAKENRIPVVVLLLGEVGSHFVPIAYYQDFVVSDWYLVYGPGIVEYLRSRYPWLQKTMKALPVGAPMIDGLAPRAPSRLDLCRRFGLNPAGRIVIYVFAHLDGNGRFISYRLWADSTHFQVEKRITSVFKSHPHIQFVLKLHPNQTLPHSPIVQYVQDQGIGNCKVVSGYPFDQMVNLADAFIVDTPSTSLLQMMTTDTPIYIFNDLFRWEPAALETLRKRAYLFDDLDAFCRQLDMDLHSGRCFEKLRVDATFLKLYAVPEEGAAADQCARAITDIALGRPAMAGSSPSA